MGMVGRKRREWGVKGLEMVAFLTLEQGPKEERMSECFSSCKG